jgi:hypothetical protein
MQIIKGMAALLLVLSLVGCGGGGGSAGAPPFGDGDGGGGGSPVASDLSLTLSSTNISNSGSEAVTLRVTAVDETRVAVAGVPIQISVDNNAVVVVGSPTTDSTGTMTATVGIGTDRSNRLITVTATSGGLTRTAAFQVTGADLQGTRLPAVIAPGAAGQIQYRLVDVNANPMADQEILVTAPGVADVTGRTGSNGEYVYNYVAPAGVSSLEVTARAGGDTRIDQVLVQSGSSTIPNVPAGSVLSASVSANASVVSVNTEATSNRSEIRALFLGASNAPVMNVRARFDLDGDPNSIGGSFASGASIVYSDPNGVATTAYIPGSRSSPTDGVKIRVCWDYADFTAGTCPNAARTTLTVTSEPLSVTIGTDNTIESGAGGLTYIKKYVVLVVDSSGQAKGDVQLSPSIDLTSYIKGYFDGPGAWNRDGPPAVDGSVGFTGPTCLNEDSNRNGVIEASEDDGLVTAGIPDNNNGTLEPRKSDVAISMVGGNRTNASGVAVLQIEYPKNVATWVNFVITVAASGVSGTEGRATWTGQLGAAADEFTADTPPSFVISPYGTAGVCTNPN